MNYLRPRHFALMRHLCRDNEERDVVQRLMARYVCDLDVNPVRFANRVDHVYNRLHALQLMQDAASDERAPQ